jgi:hypothetical protein
MAKLDGTVATLPGLPKTRVSASFRDIIDHTDFSLMLAGDARYRRVGFLADVMYLDISAKDNTPGPLFGGVDFKTQTFVSTLTPYYRVIERERSAVDLLAGARIWSIYTKLDLKPGLALGRKDTNRESWVDPVIGIRGSARLLDKLSMTLAGDIGGFGAASDLTWQVLVSLDYAPREWIAIRAGYRHLNVDYSDGGFKWAVGMDGPILGASLRF